MCFLTSTRRFIIEISDNNANWERVIDRELAPPPFGCSPPPPRYELGVMANKAPRYVKLLLMSSWNQNAGVQYFGW